MAAVLGGTRRKVKCFRTEQLAKWTQHVHAASPTFAFCLGSPDVPRFLSATSCLEPPFWCLTSQQSHLSKQGVNPLLDPNHNSILQGTEKSPGWIPMDEAICLPWAGLDAACRMSCSTFVPPQH
ncbi:uncharacterized protein WM294_004911 [Sarcoramphus papa]